MEDSARCAPLIAEESSIEKRHCSVYVITRSGIKAYWQLPILEGKVQKYQKVNEIILELFLICSFVKIYSCNIFITMIEIIEQNSN